MAENKKKLLEDNPRIRFLTAEEEIRLVVMDILGHAKIETAMRYAHPTPKRKSDAISVLNSYN